MPQRPLLNWNSIRNSEKLPGDQPISYPECCPPSRMHHAGQPASSRKGLDYGGQPAHAASWSRSSLGVSSSFIWGHILLLVWLTGCATIPIRQVPVERFVLSMSDSPASGSGLPVQGYSVPGRKPGSEMPWELFLGNAAHRLIAYIYGVNHPQSQVFYNSKTLFEILADTGLGNPALLSQHERNLRPDITDVTLPTVFEIKPQTDTGRQEGRKKVQTYLSALNRIVQPSRHFLPGTNFQGEILIRFAQGRHIWRLEWQTTEPGVVQYRWTRSRESFLSEREAHQAGQWVELTEQEMRKYGGWVAQAVEGMVSRRERLATFSGAVGMVIEFVGNAAVGVFSGILLGRGGANKKSQQPPGQGGGKVIPLPARPSPTPPVKLPAASGG